MKILRTIAWSFAITALPYFYTAWLWVRDLDPWAKYNMAALATCHALALALLFSRFGTYPAKLWQSLTRKPPE